MLYPLAGRETLAALTTVGGFFSGAVGLARAAARRTLGPLAIPMLVGGGLMWLGRNLGDAFVDIREDELRIKLGVLFDESIPINDVAKVRRVEWKLLGGLGVRSNLTNMVAVVTRAGPVAELATWRPIRLPVVPRVVYVRAQRVVVSPEDLDGFIAELSERLQT